jgi:hypothetical protein
MTDLWKLFLKTYFSYLDNHKRDYYTDTNMKLKRVIYWPNFVARRKHKNFSQSN